MLNKFRATAAAAALAICLAVPLSMPAGAACYFGECGASVSTSAAPAVQPSRVSLAPPAASAKLGHAFATHGSWSAMELQGSTLIMDQFTDGARLAIVAYHSGSISLMLSHPDWHFKEGQEFNVKADIDGHVFSGSGTAGKEDVVELENVEKGFLQALYKGSKAKITIDDNVFEITSLPDAALTIDDVMTYLKSASF